MPRDSTATRARILGAAYALFYRKGFQRASLDEIAAKAGVTKRTLYYHVRSKDALAGAMLEHQHGFVLAEMTRWMDRPAATRDARALVARLFESVVHWVKAEAAARRHWTGSGFTRIAMELADLPGHPARLATRRHKSALEAELARRLAECGARDARDAAAQVQMLLEGAMALTLIHGDVRYARLASAAARRLVMRGRS
ncbi:MAG TPA: helix-turn-helix domain-containing protein [Dongiaceae bacterium]|nr:helix-turn-helix domain-containing protein [Dongiaceae bacterium]